MANVSWPPPPDHYAVCLSDGPAREAVLIGESIPAAEDSPRPDPAQAAIAWQNPPPG